MTNQNELKQLNNDEIDKISYELLLAITDEWGGAFFNKKEAFQIGFRYGYKENTRAQSKPSERCKQVADLAEKIYIALHQTGDAHYIRNSSELDGSFESAEKFIEARDKYLGED